MYKLHTSCRACGYGKTGAPGIKAAQPERLMEVFDLRIQPLANDFRKEGEEHAGYAPLKVLFCPRCSLAQLSVTVDPKVLYSNYSYVTSPSDMMREHFERLIDDIAKETTGKSVLEIGSNDGRLLKMMKAKGYSVMGMDPAENLAEIARRNGVQTVAALFGKNTAECLEPFDIIIARHVFCHVDDWLDFVKGLEVVSHPGTLICIEVPYAGDLLNNCEFDTIYHEHLSYLSIGAVNALLKDTSLQLSKIIRYPIHGGAILLMITCKASALPAVELPESITANHWRRFRDRAAIQLGDLRDLIRSLVHDGHRVAGLGASAKSTVWINACGFTRKHIAFIADTTPQKQYTFTPGTDIPVVDEGAILRELPDYVVMWAWNYRSEVLKKFELARSKGVKFIIPVPKIEVV